MVAIGWSASFVTLCRTVEAMPSAAMSTWARRTLVRLRKHTDTPSAHDSSNTPRGDAGG